MKKLKFAVLLVIVITTTQITSCKKEYCWTCTNSIGGDEEFCGMTKKEAERKEESGYSCVRK
jgi:hypothetical protein